MGGMIAELRIEPEVNLTMGSGVRSVNRGGARPGALRPRAETRANVHSAFATISLFDAKNFQIAHKHLKRSVKPTVY